MVACVRSAVSRVLRLTLLTHDIVEAVLDRRQPAVMTLAVLMRPFAVGWDAQRAIGLSPGTSTTPLCAHHMTPFFERRPIDPTNGSCVENSNSEPNDVKTNRTMPPRPRSSNALI